MECVTEPKIFAFGRAPIKVIAFIEICLDRIIKCEKVFGCI